MYDVLDLVNKYEMRVNRYYGIECNAWLIIWHILVRTVSITQNDQRNTNGWYEQRSILPVPSDNILEDK